MKHSISNPSIMVDFHHQQQQHQQQQNKIPKAGKMVPSNQELTASTSMVASNGYNTSNMHTIRNIDHHNRSRSNSSFSKLSNSEPDLQKKSVYDNDYHHGDPQSMTMNDGELMRNSNRYSRNSDIGFDSYYKSLSQLNVSC